MLPRRIAHALVLLFFVLAGSCGGQDGALEGEPCGGWGAGPCAAGLYCEYPGACAEVDGIGECKAAPFRCDREAPVCGCDGEQYASVCDAIAAGTDVVTGDSCALDVEAGEPGGSVDPG